MARLVLDFSRRRSQILPGSPTPESRPGKSFPFELSAGLYRISSTGPYVIEQTVPASLASFYADEREAIELAWPGGVMQAASACGKRVNFHVVPLLEIGQ